MAFKLTVRSIEPSTFDRYYYGYGQVESNIEEPEKPGYHTYVVNYGDDGYRCEYQAGRFASGLYFARVEETSDAS